MSKIKDMVDSKTKITPSSMMWSKIVIEIYKLLIRPANIWIKLKIELAVDATFLVLLKAKAKAFGKIKLVLIIYMIMWPIKT